MFEGLRSRWTTSWRCAASTASQTSASSCSRAGERQPGPFAIVGDRHPVDLLEDEVGTAVLAAPAVEQAGDAGMVEAGEDLPLAQEAGVDRARVDAGEDALERHPLLELAVGALGEIDLAHAAAAEQSQQSIATDATAAAVAVASVCSLEGRGDKRRSTLADGDGEQRRAVLVGGEQPGEETGEIRVLAGDRLEPDVAGGGVEARTSSSKRSSQPAFVVVGLSGVVSPSEMRLGGSGGDKPALNVRSRRAAPRGEQRGRRGRAASRA